MDEPVDVAVSAPVSGPADEPVDVAEAPAEEVAYEEIDLATATDRELLNFLVRQQAVQGQMVRILLDAFPVMDKNMQGMAKVVVRMDNVLMAIMNEAQNSPAAKAAKGQGNIIHGPFGGKVG